MKHYKYNAKPVFFIGIAFLIIFPLFFGSIVWLLGFFKTTVFVFYSLLSILILDIVTIGWLLLSCWDKRLGIAEQTLGFETKLFRRVCKPLDIVDIMLYATQRGKEFLRIRTKKRTYYLDEQYQPWGSLLVEMEKFAKTNNIVSNLTD
ncbi:MAG TPA: hypothetical protein VFF14_11675 [Candidatus Deferrimicrobium sp.]|nr:hypothetical protein [Candidatus Deferrimicrobium sp.]